MKKCLAILLCLGMMLSTSGCGSMFSADYYFSEPYREGQSSESSGEAELRNYATLRAAILDMVYAGESSAQLRFGSYAGSLVDDLAAICLEIKSSTPIGAYAVRDIKYDTSRIVSYYTAEIGIEYKRSAEEIDAVVSVNGLGELGSHILSLMENYEAEGAVKIYSSAADEEYIRALVAESYFADPFLMASQPEVLVEGYPEAGPDRIYVLDFRYDAMPQRMEEMDALLEETARAMVAGMGTDDEANLYLRAAMLLGAYCSGGDGSEWADTAYGCIVERQASSLGFAMGYKALCDILGLDCTVVRGERNEKGVSSHGWNIIRLNGLNYHVDVSRITENPAGAFLLSDSELWGEYIWDREAYPECNSELGYVDFYGQTEAPAPAAAAEIPENVE